jgi:hypothetical protein
MAAAITEILQLECFARCSSWWREIAICVSELLSPSASSTSPPIDDIARVYRVHHPWPFDGQPFHGRQRSGAVEVRYPWRVVVIRTSRRASALDKDWNANERTIEEVICSDLQGSAHKQNDMSKKEAEHLDGYEEAA